MGERREQSGLCLCPARAAAWLVSAPYAGVMKLRRMAYHSGLMPSRPAGVPVISIGNITCGGTGKTPMVAWVVRRLKDAGRRPAILTRGYKAVAGRSDEAELLKQLTGVPVVIDPDRVAGAKAAAAGGADVLVMDDGFQHLHLRRDLDIVLIDATDPFGGAPLPAGLRREPLSALRDADAVVITRSDALDKDQLSRLKTRLGTLAPAATVHAAVHRPVAIIDEAGGRGPASRIDGKRVMAFCGIGNPQSFFATLERVGANVAARRALNDHVHYTDRIVGSLKRAAAAAGVELLVTTQKDFVKLQGASFGLGVWQLVVEIDVVEGSTALGEAVIQALK
jgi:tetraacyldisaccharide 4'-kinase